MFKEVWIYFTPNRIELKTFNRNTVKGEADSRKHHHPYVMDQYQYYWMPRRNFSVAFENKINWSIFIFCFKGKKTETDIWLMAWALLCFILGFNYKLSFYFIIFFCKINKTLRDREVGVLKFHGDSFTSALSGGTTFCALRKTFLGSFMIILFGISFIGPLRPLSLAGRDFMHCGFFALVGPPLSALMKYF